MTLRATSRMIPPGALLCGEWEGEPIEVAHSLAWPGDPEVIRVDRNMGDPRLDAIGWFWEVLHANMDVISAIPRGDVPAHLINLFRAKSREAPGQVSLF